MKDNVKIGRVKLNAKKKLWLSDGSYILNVPNATTIKERVEKHYAKKINQYYSGSDEIEDTPSSTLPKLLAQYSNLVEDTACHKPWLDYELDLKEREDAIEIKKIKFR
jgi:hypothetical protein